MGKESELVEMVKTRDRKGIAVVRLRQERTGVLYTEKKEMHHPEDFLHTFGRLFEHASVEMMLAVSVMNSGEPVAVQLLAIGGVSACNISMPEIFKFAFLSNCPEILLLHNHPSGKVKPSKEDEQITRRIEAAGEILEIHLLDHIIVADRYHGYSIKYGKELYNEEQEGA